MPAFSYVVTSSKPTSVSNAVVGSFTAPGARDLIVAKTSRLELFSIEVDGLSPLFEVQVYGRIASMELFRPVVSALEEAGSQAWRTQPRASGSDAECGLT